jgi:nucleotide-binding universal stress UspA family protein
MFERILIPLDGSLRAELILGQLGQILRRKDTRILLLRVVDPDVEPLDSAKSGYRREERKDAEKYIEDLVQKFSGRGARVAGRVVSGKVAEAILETADTERITMVAMTTHGRSGLSRWIMGSVADKVVRGSLVPVLLARSYYSDPGGAERAATAEELVIRKVLVPVDGSRASETALGPGTELATLFKSEVVVLHAEFPFMVPGPEVGSFPEIIPSPAEKDESTANAAELFRNAGLQVSRRTEVGDPASVILDQSRALGADMVVMATHGRSGFTRWVLGSVADRVLRHAGTPILIVPAKAGSKGKSKRS